MLTSALIQTRQRDVISGTVWPRRVILMRLPVATLFADGRHASFSFDTSLNAVVIEVEKHGVLGEISLGRNHREREREGGGRKEREREGEREILIYLKVFF